MCPSGHRPTQGHQVRELWASSLRDAGIDSPRGKLKGTCSRVLPLPQGCSPSWDPSARLVEPPLPSVPHGKQQNFRVISLKRILMSTYEGGGQAGGMPWKLRIT